MEFVLFLLVFILVIVMITSRRKKVIPEWSEYSEPLKQEVQTPTAYEPVYTVVTEEVTVKPIVRKKRRPSPPVVTVAPEIKKPVRKPRKPRNTPPPSPPKSRILHF